MAVVGGLLIFIGLAGMGVAIWALVKGQLGWANIASRKVAGGVLAGGLVVAMTGGGMSPKDEESDKVAVQAGSESTSTTTPSSTTSSTEETTTTAPTTTTTAAPSTTPTTGATTKPTTTTKPPTTTSTAKPTTTTTKPTTTTTAKPTTTTTATPPTAQPPTAQLAFGAMLCDAPGTPDDSSNTNEEWVELLNNGGAAVDLTGWSLHDEGANFTFVFPSFSLPAAGAVKIHTGSGANTATDLYWGHNSHIWNNTGTEIAYLVNTSGAQVTSKSCR